MPKGDKNARKQAFLAHIKHLDTKVMKLRPLVEAFDSDNGGTRGADALERLRSAVRELRMLAKH